MPLDVTDGYTLAIGGDEPAQQRQAILDDATPPPPVEQHPMVQFAQNLMQPMYPPDFNPRAAPADQRGASTDPMATLGQFSSDIHQAVGNIPVLGGLAGFGQDVVNRGPLGTGLGVNPATSGFTPGTPDYRSAVGQSLSAGIIGPESETSQIAGGLKNRIGAKASVAGDIATEGAGPVQTATQKAAVLPADAPRVGTVTTAEGQTADAGLLTRSLQTAAGTEGVPLSQHPVFADYAAKGPKGPANPRAHGGDIGIATRAVMSGDPDAMALLGDDLTDSLIQNKVAHIIRQTGAPEDVVRRGLGITMARDGAGAAEALPSDIVKTGEVTAPRPPSVADQNVATVRETVAAPSTDLNVIPGEAPPVNGTVKEQQAWLDQHTRLDGGEGQPPSDSTTTGAPEPPAAPNPAHIAQTIASQAMYLFTDAQRAALIVGHLPLLRQALPMLSDAVAAGAQDLGASGIALARGDAAMAGTRLGMAGQSFANVPLALGRTLQGLVSEGRFNQLNSGYADSLRANGIANGDKLLTGMHGPINAQEEMALHSLFGSLPVVSNLNRMYPAMLNSLRAGAALHLAQMEKLAYGNVNSSRIIDAVNELSGRGGIPDGATGAALNKVFFGPKLLSATWQVPIKAIRSLGGIATDVVTHKPIDPVDVFRVRSLTAYVATGIGLMKMASAFGLNVHTDPRDRDWGRIDLPGGSRIDLWSGFGSEARLIAQTFETLQQHDLPTDIGGAGRPRGPYDSTAKDLITNYLRGKLNPGLATVIGDFVAGKTMGGKAPSLSPLIPQAPLAIQAGLTSDPGNTPTVKGETPPAGAPSFDFTKALLAQMGAGVIGTTPKPVYDGLGAPMGDPQFGTGSILQAYTDLVNQSAGYATKWHAGDPVMAAPSTTIGAGANAINLDPTTAARYVAAIGQARDAALGPLVNSPKYQQASVTEKQKLFDTTLQAADKSAVEQFLANDIIHETDPKLIAAEAVDGFAKQTTYKDKAYWVATIDRAGKLTPDVRSAIDTLKDPGPDGKTPITTAEYLKAAPLVHEYLAHVPYGTDSRPIGTQQDWTAVEAAKVQKNARVDELVRSGIKPSQADQVAQQEILRQLPPVQQTIFLRGSTIENPERRRLILQYPTLSRFLGTNPQFTQESDAAYQNFPSGQ